MTSHYRQDVLKKLLFAVWTMLTLILVFAVGLLVYEMLEAGQQPLSTLHVPERVPREAGAAQPDAPLGTREMVLYFGGSDGASLVPEAATFEYTASTVENCRRALEALIAGPRDILTRIMPPAVKVRALYLRDNGELVIDFSRELQSDSARLRSAAYEALFVYGVVNTMTQSALRASGDPSVQRVRILIEGTPPGDAFPAHLDLRDPVKPEPDWIETAQERKAHG